MQNQTDWRDIFGNQTGAEKKYAEELSLMVRCHVSVLSIDEKVCSGV